MATNPNTPVTASFPIPPPSIQIPIGITQDGKPVHLTPSGLDFLQRLWAAIQGQGGVLDISYLLALETDSDSSGEGSEQFSALVAGLLSDDPAPDNPAQATLTALAFSGIADEPPSPPSIPTLTIPANLTTGLAVPLPKTLSAIMDACLGSVRGSLIVRNATTWVVLPIGTAGQVLTSNGTDPAWV